MNRSVKVKKMALLATLTAVVLSYQACSPFNSTHDSGSSDLSSNQKCSVGARPADSQRLTKLEYNNVIRDLFGLTNDFAANFSVPAAGSAGFTTESSGQNISADIVFDFYNAAIAVTDALFAKSPNPLLTCTSGDACAKQIITDLTTRAFRRPPTVDEVNLLYNLYKSSGASFSDSMKIVVTGVLLSPQFIFRTYDLPPVPLAQVPLTDYELASRLSFFIWGSIPDKALMAAAAAGSLQDSASLQAQALRMLKDPKASYLSRNFGSQWVGLENFDATSLDTTRFPKWNAGMKASMRNETLAFMDNVFLSNQSIMDFITAKYTFVDQNVSQIYGITGIQSAQFTRVNLDQNRIGIFGQPAILAMNSSSDHTSPVRRGKWVLDRILCSAPGAPPVDVPPLPSAPQGDLTDESLIRTRLAQHRNSGSSCFGCHSVMDPVGLSFENFDSMGFYRTTYVNGAPVDASGQLPTGERLNGYTDVAQILKTDTRFPVCFTAKLTSFAQGRDATSFSDRCSVQSVVNASMGTDKKLYDLVIGIVLDPGFRQRIVNF